MIEFFRKIRRNLLAENKFSKYLLYAIGEIMLVVIGILIALQLNNLNEIKKNKGYERDYLLRIKTDLNKDITELERHFRADTVKLNSATIVGRFLNSDTIAASPETITNNFFVNFRLNWFEGKNVVFDEMKSSGKISLILSDSLRNKIQNYYRLFDEVIKQEKLNISFIVKYNEGISASLNMSPYIELAMPPMWNASTTQLNTNDLSNKLINFSAGEKALLVENYSLIKRQILGNHAIRLNLYQDGIQLTLLIDNYLDYNR